MEATEVDAQELDHQADRIERVLMALSLPVRVSGGAVAEGKVRYHVTPVPGTEAGRLEWAAGRVAEAIGVREVKLLTQDAGLTLEVPLPAATPLRLLPLLDSLGPLPPVTAVAGLTESGHPLLISLSDSLTRHVLVSGGTGSGKSELLRTLVVSLGLTSRPSELETSGIDLTGRELGIVEALPHSAAGLALNSKQARDLLAWLGKRSRELAVTGGQQAEMVVAIDDLGPLAAERDSRGLLEALLRGSQESGMHLLAACGPETAEVLAAEWTREDIVWASAIEAPEEGRASRPHWFRFRGGADVVVARAAWMSAGDLNRAAGVLSARFRDGQSR
jgi:S-DNA-T family DNA segregation ATPase FtsK/SpoIIIE